MRTLSWKGRSRFGGLMSLPTRRNARSAGAATEGIALRAYEIFLARGGQHGNDIDDWLQAEAELSAPASKTRTAARTRSKGKAAAGQGAEGVI
jgi:hypothetical protein